MVVRVLFPHMGTPTRKKCERTPPGDLRADTESRGRPLGWAPLASFGLWAPYLTRLRAVYGPLYTSSVRSTSTGGTERPLQLRRLE